MIKKILIFISLFIFIINSSFALVITPKTEGLYNRFYKKIENKFSNSKKISLLNGLSIKLEKFKNIKKYKNNAKIINIIDQFLFLNKKNIFNIRKQIILDKFQNSKTETTDNYDSLFINEKHRRKKIMDNYSYTKYFKNISYTKNNLFLENGVWYTYNFKSYSFFPDNVEIGLKDFKHNGIDVNKALLFVLENNKIGFVKNPHKVRLINDDIISDVKNKYYLLEEIKDDLNKANNKNYDKQFIELKNKSKQITGNLNKESKIKNIYNYILKNTKYSSIIDFKNYKIFSGIETYLNNDGICEGYSKLMTYMLLFGGVDNVSVIRGYVIDAQDFPDVGHAWVKVGNEYYDPTFDDPVGAAKDRNIGDYKFFNMPKDIFYTNRYNHNDLPSNIKKLSLIERKKIIQKNLFNLYNKYKNSDYKLMKLIKLKKEHNIAYDSKINLNNFNKIIPLNVVTDFSFTDNGKKKKITGLKYFKLDGINITNLLDQLDYDLKGKYFFLWKDKNGKSTYRLGYNVKTK